MRIQTPIVIGQVKISDIPKRSHGTNGKSVSERRWLKLFKQILVLAPGMALKTTVSNQTSYVTRRLYEVAKTRNMKLKTAVRGTTMYIWLLRIN